MFFSICHPYLRHGNSLTAFDVYTDSYRNRFRIKRSNLTFTIPDTGRNFNFSICHPYLRHGNSLTAFDVYTDSYRNRFRIKRSNLTFTIPDTGRNFKPYFCQGPSGDPSPFPAGFSAIHPPAGIPPRHPASIPVTPRLAAGNPARRSPGPGFNYSVPPDAPESRKEDPPVPPPGWSH